MARKVDPEVMIKFMNNRDGFEKYNHMNFTVVEDGYCECEVVLTQEGKNPQGVAHGSLMFTLCDCVTGVAAATSGYTMLTQSANIHFLRPGIAGKLTAKGKEIRRGRTTGLYSADVYDENGKLLCAATFEVYFMGDLDWDEIARKAAEEKAN